MTKTSPLTAANLRSAIEHDVFDFHTTDEIADFEGMVGQERAMDALAFAVDMARPGYNMYLMGPAGLGKQTLLKRFLDRAVAATAADDWCYVFNFDEPQQPRAIRLPAGQGRVFRDDMRQLVKDLQTAIPAAFESEQYFTRRQKVRQALQEKTRKAFNELANRANQHNIMFLRDEDAASFVPLAKGTPLSAEDYDALPEEEKTVFEQAINQLQAELDNILHLRNQWQKEATDKINRINREVGMFATAHLIDSIRQKYRDIDKIVTYLDAIQEDVINGLHDIQEDDGGSDVRQQDYFGFQHYDVNLLVDNAQTKGAPIVHEDNPVYASLTGQVEYVAQMGAQITDYRYIRAGALHRANGGYLVLDAHKLLAQPHAWDTLKRALVAGQITIQSINEAGQMAMVSLEPEPIPLDIKVILIGSRSLYYSLEQDDVEFSELFKVEVDFSETIECTRESLQQYAAVIAALVRKNGLLPFDQSAVKKVIEYGMRQIEDTTRLSTHMHSLVDLLIESDYWARKEKHTVVTRANVQQAEDKQVYRADRSREQIYDEIRKGVIRIDVDGEKVATVNGLFVIETGRLEFAQPARITANVRIGDGDIIDIEREVELGGALHSKGVLILSSYLGAHYATRKQLSMYGSLVFEQSYGSVDGDSATVGELCALLSALSGLAVKQSLAITGSADQHGNVQAIGGINEKIEGFYDICKLKGFTGKQGVILPAANVPHLILRDDVIASVEAGEFYLYPVDTVDQAISLLTGLPAGERDAAGNFPEDSVNYKVEQRLLEMAELKQDDQHKDEHDDEQTKDNTAVSGSDTTQ